MSASQACEGRRPCPRRRRRSRPGRRRGASGPAGRTGVPAAPSLAVSRAAASGRPGCAASLRAALAHGPLRNRQRRGFPRGGSLAATITHQPAPPRLTKWRRPWSRRRPLPGPILCEARDLSTWNTSAEDAADCKACGREPSPRGPRYTRGRRRTPPPPPAPRPLRLLGGKPPRPRG